MLLSILFGIKCINIENMIRYNYNNFPILIKYCQEYLNLCHINLFLSNQIINTIRFYNHIEYKAILSLLKIFTDFISPLYKQLLDINCNTSIYCNKKTNHIYFVIKSNTKIYNINIVYDQHKYKIHKITDNKINLVDYNNINDVAATSSYNINYFLFIAGYCNKKDQ